MSLFPKKEEYPFITCNQKLFDDNIGFTFRAGVTDSASYMA